MEKHEPAEIALPSAPPIRLPGSLFSSASGRSIGGGADACGSATGMTLSSMGMTSSSTGMASSSMGICRFVAFVCVFTDFVCEFDWARSTYTPPLYLYSAAFYFMICQGEGSRRQCEGSPRLFRRFETFTSIAFKFDRSGIPGCFFSFLLVAEFDFLG